MRRALVTFVLFGTTPLLAQAAPEPMFGYDGEWRQVSSQLVELAEAFPAEKFAWRPGPGVRSTSEVYVHVILSNFYMLKAIGFEMPSEVKQDMEKTVTSKADVIGWLKRSLEAAKQAHAEAKTKDLQRKIGGDFHLDSTVGDIYLHMITHTYEHMGQLVAYARMNGVVPPWSKKQ